MKTKETGIFKSLKNVCKNIKDELYVSSDSQSLFSIIKFQNPTTCHMGPGATPLLPNCAEF